MKTLKTLSLFNLATFDLVKRDIELMYNLKLTSTLKLFFGHFIELNILGMNFFI